MHVLQKKKEAIFQYGRMLATRISHILLNIGLCLCVCWFVYLCDSIKYIHPNWLWLGFGLGRLIKRIRANNRSQYTMHSFTFRFNSNDNQHKSGEQCQFCVVECLVYFTITMLHALLLLTVIFEANERVKKK